ncbi:MAG: SpoIIE family protein phosphatase [Bdellovibrionaceae bacterium]|nr:SpoIIE family protein phosphatase [Pseudobdellovibrionaceae bacterium]
MVANKFSIRYKILILLTVIPIVTLGIYGLLAVKVFRDDKIAYVFDSSRNISASLATQVKIQLNSVLGTAKFLLQDYLLQGQFSTLSQKLFENEAQVEAVGVFKVLADRKGYTVEGRLEKSKDLFDSIWAGWGPEGVSILDTAIQKKRLVKKRIGDDQLFLLEVASSPNRPEIFVFVIIYRGLEIKDVFSENKGMQAFLIDHEGKVLFGPEADEGIALSAKVPASFLSRDSKTVTQGAEAVRDSQKKDLLVSYSKVGFSDLMVVTAVDQNRALNATQILVRKSGFFFVVMISFIVILSLLVSRSLTEALTSLFLATRKVSEGRFDFRVNVKSNDEIGTLAENFNLMAGEVSRLLVQTAEKARMENELLTAKTVQETLFPLNKNRVGPLGISGFYEPSSECGGDWWHYCTVGDRALLWIGDATGHGAPAALITSAAKSAATIIELLDVTPAHALELLNRCIYDVSKGQIMMTFFLAAFDFKTSKLTYANASHEAPFLIRKSDSPLRKKDLVSLNEVTSPRLGQARDTKYRETTVDLELGDMVFLYTDGVLDIQSSNSQAWGEREFLKALIQANVDSPSADVSVARFVETFQAFRQGSSLIDDVTFFVVKNEGTEDTIKY